MTPPLHNFHLLAKECFDHYRNQDGERLKLLDQEKLKVAWIMERYRDEINAEFYPLLNAYMETGEYINACKI